MSNTNKNIQPLSAYQRKRKRENTLKVAEAVQDFHDNVVGKFKAEVEFQASNCLFPFGTELDEDLISEYHQQYESDVKNKIVNTSIINIPVPYLALRQQHHTFTYSHLLKNNLWATNQGQSGRCWLFAGLNTIRYALIVHHDLPKDFQLSQAHLFYWDKIERANTFLEQAINTRHLEITNPILLRMLDKDKSILSDGGFWQSFSNLVVKYGVMPITKFDECWNSYSSEYMNVFYRRKLIEQLQVIRESKLSEEALREMKDKIFMADVYKLISNFMSVPPETFDWHFYTGGKDGHGSGDGKELHKINNLTPMKFYEEFVKPIYDITDKIVLQHDPRSNIKLYHTYNNRYDSNLVGMPPSSYIAVPLNIMKEAIFLSIKHDQPCWIGCDVMKDHDWTKNILDPDSFNYPETLNDQPLITDKAMLYTLKLSECSHAMTITGIDVNTNRKPGQKKYIKYRVENSWGYHHDIGKEDPGHLLMTDRWFDQHMYQVVVSLSLLPIDIQEKIEAHMFHPIELDLNELPTHPPMGSSI